MKDSSKKAEDSVSDIRLKSIFREWFCRVMGPASLEIERNPAKRLGESRSRGIWRFSLLVLVIAVIAMNLQFITRHSMVTHDSKQVLGIFDYVYSSYFFSGELPQWMAYGLHGLDARAFDIAFLSAPSYLTMFAGKLLGIRDSLTLFSMTLCIEQLFFLLGMYLLSGWLFREPLTRFCVCLTAVGTIAWSSQLFFNLRIFCLLPLAFYLILRLKHDEKGYWGWLTGIVCVLGPLGSTYTYLFWAFLLTVFSLTVFCGRFGSLKSMFKPHALTIISALCFIGLTLFFVGTLWHALDNSTFGSPGRDGSGNVTLNTFLTYGGNNLSDMISSLMFPPQFMGNTGGHAGMADYIGLIGLCCLPVTLVHWRRFPQAYPFIVISITVAALSLGGVLSSAIYLFPGMHLFRHVGFLSGVIKMLALILAGFGMDQIIGLLRRRALIQSPTIGVLVLMCLVIILYVDLNIGGSGWASVCSTIQSGPDAFLRIIHSEAIYTLARATLLLALAFSAWHLCRPSTSREIKKPDFTLLLLVICVFGDCLFFQSELNSFFIREKQKFEFPAVKLDWPVDISRDQSLDGSTPLPQTLTNLLPVKEVSDIGSVGLVFTNTLSKYQAWTNAPGAEYQAAVSCILQWDPPKPYFRADWVAKNVTKMQAALKERNKQELAIISGFDDRKFRLIPADSVIHVNSDQEALILLGTNNAWDKTIILTDHRMNTATKMVPSDKIRGKLELGNFSANHFSLTVSNEMPEPGWLVFADAYAPGWCATVDKKPVPIVKAYGAYKAIKVYPGTSQVSFSYHDGIHSTCLSIFAVFAACGSAAGALWMIWMIGREVAAK